MNVAVMKTKAEQALVQQFEALEAKLPGDGWVRDARKRAIGVFASQGLPHRRNESWKYTDLRALMKEAYAPAVGGRSTVAPADLSAAIGVELAGLTTIRVVFVNGRFTGIDAAGAAAGGGRGYQIESLATVIDQPGYEWIEPFLSVNDVSGDAGVLALNAAFATDGAVVRITGKPSLDVPLHLVFVTDSRAPSASFVRNLIKVDTGIKATIIESHVSMDNGPRQTSAVTQVHVGEAAVVDHIKTLSDGADGVHAGAWIATLDADATYRAFQFTAGAGLARNETLVTYRGQGGKADISGVMLGRGRDHIDTTLVVDHAVPACESRELFKAVLDDTARGVFQGKVIVRPDAQKSDGKQMAQALMLSEAAEFDSKPELEIYADDVVCGHGSTAAQLDKDLIFYCRARGIPESVARALLIESFVGEAIAKVQNPAIAEALTAAASRWLNGKAAPAPNAS